MLDFMKCIAEGIAAKGAGRVADGSARFQIPPHYAMLRRFSNGSFP